MRTIAKLLLVTLWGLGIAIGIRIASQEGLDPVGWALIGTWAVVAAAATAIVVDAARTKKTPSDG